MGLQKQKGAVGKALELEEALGAPHAAVAYIRVIYDWDAETGEKEFRRALELNPNDSTTFLQYGVSLLHLGRFAEAEAAARQALEIDPFSPLINTMLGPVLMFGRRYEAAVVQLRKTLD